ncbi:MAG TPA: GFA family protein [Thermohalobaculum sp.]|nr:GFA family protein [Thermohalobaculum sp.]
MTMTGRCLCGAVTLRATGIVPEASACHCVMCRRWGGAPFWGMMADSVEASGPVRTYRSSPFAERAFCGTCGSHLWIRDDGKSYDLTPGLFDAAKDFPLTREVYADRAFACVPLAGGHPRVTAAEYEAENMFVPGEEL